MSRETTLRLIRAALIATGAVVAAITTLGLYVLSVDIQDEADTLEEKS